MSSIDSNNNRSSEEIEREVEQVRANVRSTLGDIRESLSPGQMLDQGLDYVRGSGGADFTRNFGRQLRDHPMPVALIGAGIAWLLLSERMGGGYVNRHGRPRYTADELYTDPDRHHVHVDGDEVREGGHEGLGSRVSGMASGAGSMASNAGHRMSDMASGAGERIGDTAHSLRDRAGSVASSVSETVSGVADSARRMVHDARDRVTGAASSAAGYVSSAGEHARYAGDGMRHYGSRARDYGHQAQRSMSHMVEEQPMILGAVGFAVGALLGAALPSTKVERRYVGPYAERAREEARRMAREGFTQASDTASSLVGEARDALDERGFSKRGMAEAVHNIGETVREQIDPKRQQGSQSGQSGLSGNGGSGSSTSASGMTGSGTSTTGSPTSHH